MKSLKKVALAAAVACVAAGNAFAVVDLDAGTGAITYAKELTVANTAFVDVLDTTVKLGFGVSNGQTRYVRYDLGNAKWAANLVAGDLAVAASAVALSAGGTTNDSYVIFQITAAANYTPAEAVTLANATGVKVVAPTSNVTLTYSLYETGADAVNGTGSGRLAVASNKTLAGVAKSTLVTLTPASATASVNEAYKKFTSGTAVAGSGQLKAIVGQLAIALADQDAGTVGTQVSKDPATGLDVTLAQITGAASKVVVSTDKNWDSVSDINVATANDCTTGAISDTNGSRTATTTDITFGAAGFTGYLCYTANGTAAIETQNFKLAVDFTAGTGLAGAAVADDESAADVGSFNRDGTILKAAFADAGVSGFGNSIHLTNTSSTAAAYTTSCLTEAGRVAGLAGSVAGNSGVRRGVNSGSGFGCPANTRGIELTMAVPTGTVIGSVVRQNVTTGQAGFDGMVGNQ